jgi:16S rRNA (uracil1498-N3)-methyltransferase
MRVPRVFVPGPVSAGRVVDLPPAEARHLALVLRRLPGQPVEVLTAGGIFAGLIREVTSEPGSEPRVSVEIVSEAPRRPPAVVPWTVAVALVKGRDMDLAVRVASELGLERLVPLETGRAVVRRARGGSGTGEPGGAGSRRTTRWERLAREAAKQCGRAPPLAVERPRALADFLAAPGGAARRWVALPGAPFPPRADFIEAGSGPARVATAVFLVGPEGGIAPEEAEAAAAAGFRPFGFPTPVLRTPTAVLLVAALGALLEPLLLNP